MKYYEDLLKYSENQIDEFFENVSLHEKQFKYDQFNEICFKKMFEENCEENIKSVKQLKTEIEGLKEVCSNCSKFYLKARNKSKMHYDLIMGQFFENLIINYLKEHHGINVCHADKINKNFPDCMILNKDKSIVAYIEVKYHGAPFIYAINKINRYCYEGSITLDYKKIIKQLEIIYTDLDRPVFYLHWVDFPCLKGIFFETSDQVKENIYKNGVEFERRHREGDLEKSSESVYLGKFYSSLLEMGDFEEFINTIKELRK